MAHEGTLHRYNNRLVAFEHASANSSQANSSPNTILWIGGLGDGLLTVHYPATLAASLPPNWKLVEVLLSSAYKGWATGSLKRDARELGDCVAYFKSLRPGGKVVLMGHSTGCQDIMEYVVGADHEARARIDGAILQAGVSDREAWDDMCKRDVEMGKQIANVMEVAESMVKEGKGKEPLVMEGNPVASLFGTVSSAYRTHSLLAKGGDDDFFSADLADSVLEGTFGKFPVGASVLLLWGGEDPYVPSWVDKEALLKRWGEIVKKGGGVVDEVNGGIVKGAHHNLNDDPEDVVRDLVNRVVGFVKGVESGSHGDGSRL